MPDDDRLEDEQPGPKLPHLGAVPDLPEMPDVPSFDPDREEVVKAPEVPASEVPEPPQWDYTRPDYTKKHLEKGEAGAYLGLGVGLSAAYTLIGCTVIGWGVGWLIDRGGPGVMGQAIGALVGAVTGLGGAIFTVVRAQNRSKDG